MKTGKKITALILAAMLAVSTSAVVVTSVSAEENAPVAVSSTDEKVWGDYHYTVLDDGTVEITDYAGSDTDLVIPSEIDGKKVTSIGEEAFIGHEIWTDKEVHNSLESVEIPNSVTKIGAFAFYGCTNLKNITILEGVTEIGNSAFRWCTSLTDVIIPNSVTVIGGSAFEVCTSLTNVIIPNSVTVIKASAFRGCTSLEEITIPNSITKYFESIFRHCISLKNVTIQNGLERIAPAMFYGCTSLESIIIPDSVTAIGGSAFVGCTSLTDIEIPDSVTTIVGFALGYDYDEATENYIPILNFTIHGKKGTAAETYAKENGFKFVEFTDEPIDESSQESSEESIQAPSNTDSNNSTTNNTNTSENGKTAETGKNAVATGDSSNTIAMASIFAVGIISSAIMIFKKKRT